MVHSCRVKILGSKNSYDYLLALPIAFYGVRLLSWFDVNFNLQGFTLASASCVEDGLDVPLRQSAIEDFYFVDETIVVETSIIAPST